MPLTQTIISEISGVLIPLIGDDIDTDRIIPARFLRCVTFDGLGASAFYDERFDSAGIALDHPLNDGRFKAGGILLVGRNFGCGSSREHAPQAILRYGIKAIIGISFADIFAGNCTAIGLPAVRISPESHTLLMQLAQSPESVNAHLNIAASCLTTTSSTFAVEMQEHTRLAFLQGLWDTTALLLISMKSVRETAQRLPYMQGYFT